MMNPLIFRKVDKTRAEWTIKNVLNYLQQKKLNLDCAVQRGFVWEKDPERMSQFIMSLILERPIPPIYTAKRDSVYFAIDGKQRISTVKLFIDDGFVLAGLDPIELEDPETGDIEEVDINGLHFSELDDVLQDAIESATLTIIVINDATDDEICEYFYYLNNGMPLNSITMTRAKARSKKQIQELGSHDIFKNALTAKALAAHTNEDIVIKTYAMLHEEEPSLETKVIRKMMAEVVITKEDQDQIAEVFNRIMAVHSKIDDKKIAKRLLTRTHMISVVPFIWRSLDDGISDEQMAKWFSHFFCGKKSVTDNTRYNQAARDGSMKKTSVKIRNDELDADYNKFFEKDLAMAS